MIDADDIDHITLKNVVNLMESVIKDNHKSYVQLFLEKAMHDEWLWP